MSLTSEQAPERQSVLNLSVVVPVLNELSALPSLVAGLNRIDADQIVIVDGGSDDGTYEWLQLNWVNNDNDGQQQHCLLESPAGRARQMNCGAAACLARMIVFLHADSILPLNAKKEILNARVKGRLWGRFDVAFHDADTDSLAMKVIALFINIRSRMSGIATGDQAIFVDTDLFKMIDGYVELPLMEDIVISKQLKRHCRPYCSRMKASTSARRWRNKGIIKTVLLMWFYRLAFFFGVPATRLASSYRNVR